MFAEFGCFVKCVMTQLFFYLANLVTARSCFLAHVCAFSFLSKSRVWNSRSRPGKHDSATMQLLRQAVIHCFCQSSCGTCGSVRRLLRNFLAGCFQRVLLQNETCFIVPMGGGTFFKVGGMQVHVKKYRTFCDLNWPLWRHKCWHMTHYLWTIWRANFHYFRQNYSTMKTYRWATWNSNKLLQGRPRSAASPRLIIQSILSE